MWPPDRVVKVCMGGDPVKHVILSTAIDFHFTPKPYVHKVIKEIKTNSERMGEEVAVREVNKIIEARNIGSSAN